MRVINALSVVIPDYPDYPPWEEIKHWFAPPIPKNVFRRREKGLRKWFYEVYSKDREGVWTWDDVERAYDNRKITVPIFPKIEVNK